MSPAMSPAPGAKVATPLSILGSKLKVWFSPDSIQLGIGSKISAWNDLSGNGNHVAQGAFSNQPTKVAAVLDGFAGARFSANGGAPNGTWLSKSSGLVGFAAGDSPQLFIVTKITGIAGDYVWMMPSAPTGYGQWQLDQDNVTYFDTLWNGASFTRTSYTQTDKNLYRFLRIYVDEANNQRIERNGTLIANRANSARLLPEPCVGLVLGSASTAVSFQPMTGDIIEAAAINNSPSAGELADLMTYFRTRYPSLAIV